MSKAMQSRATSLSYTQDNQYQACNVLTQIIRSMHQVAVAMASFRSRNPCFGSTLILRHASKQCG